MYLEINYLTLVLIFLFLLTLIFNLYLWAKIMTLTDLIKRYRILPSETIFPEQQNIKEIEFKDSAKEEKKRKNRERVQKHRNKKRTEKISPLVDREKERSING